MSQPNASQSVRRDLRTLNDSCFLDHFWHECPLALLVDGHDA